MCIKEWFVYPYTRTHMALELMNLPANVEDIRDTGPVPGLGRSAGGGNGNLLQYSCLDNPTDREAWRATVQGRKELGMTEAT